MKKLWNEHREVSAVTMNKILAKMNKSLYIHIGTYKTGTTFLQEIIFPKLKNVNYIFRFHLEDKINRNKITLISDEFLSGCPFPEHSEEERRIIANNLKKLFLDAKIILATREKSSWLQSLYSSYVKDGKGMNDYKYFLTHIDMNYTNFEPYVKYLKQLFTDVYVYRFEDFKENPKKIVAEICGFMGVDIPTFQNKRRNVSFSKKHFELIHLCDKIFKSPWCHRVLIRFIRDINKNVF